MTTLSVQAPSPLEALTRHVQELSHKARAIVIVETSSGAVIAHSFQGFPETYPQLATDVVVQANSFALWDALRDRSLISREDYRVLRGRIDTTSACVYELGSTSAIGAIWILGSNQDQASLCADVRHLIEMFVFGAQEIVPPPVQDSVIEALIEGHGSSLGSSSAIVLAIAATSRRRHDVAAELDVQLRALGGRLHWPAGAETGCALVSPARLSRAVSSHAEICVGSSIEISSGSEFRAAHHNARLALLTAQARGGHASIGEPDVFAEIVLRSATAAVRDIGAEGLLPIAALIMHDSRRSSDMIATLLLWLDLSCDGIRAARELGIHANTLRYRIRRAAEITGLDFDNAHHRAALHLCLRGLITS